MSAEELVCSLKDLHVEKLLQTVFIFDLSVKRGLTSLCFECYI